MDLNHFFSAVAWPIATGIGISFALESAAVPRPMPFWKRSSPVLLTHMGLCLLLITLLLCLTGRPWCATIAAGAMLFILLLVNRAKLESLGEPFVFQDFEYFRDAIRHPRLYLPFLGLGKSLMAVAAILIAIHAGASLETSLFERLTPGAFLIGLGFMGGVATGLIALGTWRSPAPTFHPGADMAQLGWLGSIWSYGRAERLTPYVFPAAPRLTDMPSVSQLPHIIAVQSESFFDPRPIFPGIRNDVLEAFDALRSESVLCGPLVVPAWGANTVRTEFAFLTGIGEAELGVHKFNPYRRLRSPLPSVASRLKAEGYRTICVHPYSAGFYERDRIFPLLGFDEFIDIREFGGAHRVGPFVSDLAVVQKIESVLARSSGQPLFLFVITMENHGPLHLERVEPEDIDRYHCSPPPNGCEDLTVYLRHLANADKMVGRLRSLVDRFPGDAWIVWFGDHVPIMPGVYQQWGAPNGNTEFALWRKGDRRAGQDGSPLRVEDLGSVLLRQWAQALSPAHAGVHNIAVPRHPSSVHV